MPVCHEISGTHRLSVYADYSNIMGGNVHTIKGKAEALVVDRIETGLKANADKSKNMVMSRDQNAGRIDGIKIYNNTFQSLGEFK
jgi:hypothetical protein